MDPPVSKSCCQSHMTTVHACSCLTVPVLKLQMVRRRSCSPETLEWGVQGRERQSGPPHHSRQTRSSVLCSVCFGFPQFSPWLRKFRQQFRELRGFVLRPKKWQRTRWVCLVCVFLINIVTLCWMSSNFFHLDKEGSFRDSCNHSAIFQVWAIEKARQVLARLSQADFPIWKNIKKKSGSLEEWLKW
jgi:hypothetical protein